MAKVISQETFDAVVKENLEEFDMSPESAVQDAIQQFEAQGVNLSNIVKDLTLTDNQSLGDGQHPLLASIQCLEVCLNTEPIDQLSVINSCSEIKSECDIDLAHRCLAGSNKAYPTLIQAWLKCSSDDSIECILETLCSLCNGQPDLLDSRSQQLALNLLESSPNTNLVSAATRFIRLNCIKHENNRQSFVKAEVIPILVDLLSKYKSNKEIVKEVCFTLRVLTFDDDVRAAFGKAHDHAKIIVTEAGALGKILDICQYYIQDKSVLGELFSTLGRLAVRNEFCQEIMDLGGLQLMLQTLDKNMDHPGITKQVLGVLKAIAGNDAVKVAVVSNNGLELIVTALIRHAVHPGICETGCAALAALVLRNPAHCTKVAMESGVADILVKILQIHKDLESVSKKACMAVRNIVARTREHCQAFLDLGVEPLIQYVYVNHQGCQDEAKAALRDLGCKVELKELWKGEGKGIH